MSQIRGTIDRFEGDTAVIRTDDQKDILCPKSVLDATLVAGDAVTLRIEKNQAETGSQSELAKEILNQILEADHS